MSAPPATTHAPPIDRWTVVAITVIAWAIADLLHEGGGHGGTALLVGAKPLALTTTYFNYDEATVSRTAQQLISAGGAVVNVLVGVPAALVAARAARPTPRARFFLWLFAAFNLLTAFGYLLYSGVGGIGDFANLLVGVAHAGVWRVVEIVAGTLLYFVAAPALLWPGLAPFVGGGADRQRRARTLTLLPYLAGGATSLASGVLNPLGWKIVLISAVAAAFGGNALLAWYFPARAARSPSDAPPAYGIARSRAWLAAAALALAAFVALGHGVTF